jgi:hypothetical protein
MSSGNNCANRECGRPTNWNEKAGRFFAHCKVCTDRHNATHKSVVHQRPMVQKAPMSSMMGQMGPMMGQMGQMVPMGQIMTPMGPQWVPMQAMMQQMPPMQMSAAAASGVHQNGAQKTVQKTVPKAAPKVAQKVPKLCKTCNVNPRVFHKSWCGDCIAQHKANGSTEVQEEVQEQEQDEQQEPKEENA